MDRGIPCEATLTEMPWQQARPDVRVKPLAQDGEVYVLAQGQPRPAEARRRWATLIKRIYQADPLRCPNCGATMKIISFIEAHQETVIERILRHCGLWDSRQNRAPPTLFERVPGPPDDGSASRAEVDQDFAEYAPREAAPDFDSQLSPFED